MPKKLTKAESDGSMPYTNQDINIRIKEYLDKEGKGAAGKTSEEMKKKIKKLFKKSGGMVKGYMGGGEIEVAMDDSPNSGMITTKGFGASRKT